MMNATVSASSTGGWGNAGLPLVPNQQCSNP